MIKSFLTNCALFVWLLSMLTLSQLSAQQTVFTENFNTPGTPQNPNFTTTGPIGTSLWTVIRSGNDFGAKIDQGFLTLTNDVGGTGNVKGWVLASTSTSNFLTAYNPILSQNPGIVSWTFNMRQLRANPAGLTDGLYGVGYVLAGTEGSTNKVGKGYAIMLGQSGNKDAIRFVTYNNGIQTYYTKLSSTSSGLADFGREYTSIRVEYNPLNNEWSLYLRKDNTSSFNDPKSGTLVYQGKIANAEFVNEPLTITGAYWNAATGSKQTAFFDNVSVSVVTPEIISINPDSKIANSGAFTLTVDGKGFTTASKVYWNGSLRTTTYISATQISASIPATDLPSPGIVPITVRNGSFISNAVDFEIESSGVPVLTLSKNNLPFISTVQGTAAAATDTYTISGSNLTASAILTAPANFEISVNNDAYADTKTLGNSGGVLVNQPLTVKARLKSTAPAGNYTGNITHATIGALTTKVVGLTGRVLATEPTADATLPTFTDITSTGFKLSWTNSVNGGDQRIVLIRPSTEVNGLPVDATTYNANAAFATGTLIGTDNYVVYKGTGNSVQITGLEPDKLYHISIIEFNGGPGTENYRTAGLTGSAKTLNSPAGLQVKKINTSYKIDFDNTVDGVNLDTFQGSGIAQIAEPGQLDSDSWAFTNFSGGNIGFGGFSPEDSSYENGTSDGDVDETGIYAFNVSETSENYTLGIQPGGTDFNPGTITLRVHNRTPAAITSLNIGYKVYIKNAENSSTKVSFSHKLESATNFSGNVTIVDVVSEATADLNPSWKAYYRVVTLTGLNIPEDKYYNLRWSGSLVSGTGAQDEFGIDDIEVVAGTTTNPIANFVSFDGIAEDFVLQGNASLSADLSVQNRLLFNGGKLAIKDKTLTIVGTVVNTTLQGITGGIDSKLIIRGNQNPQISFDQTTLGTTNAFHSFSALGTTANKVTVLNNIMVNQLLKTDNLQILDLGTNILSGSLTTIQNNGTVLTQNTGTTPFPAGKTWGGTGILNLNATSTAQSLVAGTYNNLTLSSTGGTAANADITVNGILNLPAANPSATTGSLSMASYTLTMGPDGTNTGLGDVTGIIKRDLFVNNKLYTFGHPNTSITFPPNAPGGTLPSTMSIKLSIGSAVTWKPTPVLRSVDIIQTGGTLTKAIIRQHYLDTELNGNVESKLVFWGKAISAAEFEQGRSSINTDLNWVEITNANVGLYFTSTFGQVTITLDQTEVAGVVWNGSQSTSWTTAANWTPNAKPSSTSTVIIPNLGITANYPQLNPSEEIGSLNIQAGAIVNSTGTEQLFLTLGAGAWQNNGTFNPGSASTVTFKNIDATISGSTTFNNLTIASGAGLRALEGNYMSIAGVLTNAGTMFTTLIPNTIEFIGTGQTIPAPRGEAFGGYHNLIVSGTGTTLAPSIATLNLRGNLTLNQPLSFVGKTINLAGVSDQTISGSAAIDFNDLIVNKETGAVILANNITVNGELTLTKGNLVLGANNLTLGQNAVAGTFTVNNMIAADGSGLVLRPFTSIGEYFFPIGELTSNPAYSPIKVKITSGTFSNAFVGVSVVDAIHPNNYSSQNYISRYWNVKQTGITNAKADITANYVQAEVLVPETTLAAGQLDGTFDILTNPWKKVGTLATNTLTATNVNLTNGQNSVFTGIKGGDFSVEVYGYGEFCQGSSVSMNAVNSGGDAPYTYSWTPTLPNASVVSIPTATVGEFNYQLTVTDANGFVAFDNNSPVKILPASVGGAISNSTQQICVGTLPVALQLGDSVGSVLYWQKSLDSNFTTFENLPNTTTTLSSVEIGPVMQTTYVRAVIQNGTCEEKVSGYATISIKSTTWNGTSWSNSEAPNATTSAIFTGNYTTSAEGITACSCEVSSGVVLTISANSNITIQNNIVNNGSIIVESDGNLIQINDDALNTGNVLVKRQLSFKGDERKEYNYLISPVVDGNLKTAMYRKADGITQVTAPSILYHTENNNRFYNSSGAYIAGRSLAVQEPAFNSGATNIAYFEGKPFNGKIAYNLAYSGPSLGYNLVGNPYPSNLDVNKLFADNRTEIESTFRFWDNTVNNVYVQQGSGYSGNAYAIFNALTGAMGTGLPAPGFGYAAGSSPKVPNNIVKIGQGFMVRALATGKILQYRNDVRSAVNGGSVFYGKLVQEDRYWLQMTAPSGITSTTAMVYFEDGNNLFGAEDSRVLNNSDLIYSIVQNEKIGINGRSNFTNADSIPLGTQHFVTGNYTISLGIQEGIFSNGQNIYLKDKQTNTITNLSEGNYTFNVNSGAHTGRFEIVYQSDIVLVTDSKVKEGVVVYRDHDDFVIKSPKVMSMIQVYDVSGKLVTILHPHNKQSSLNAAGIPSGMYVLKIITIDGEVINKKISR